MIDSIRDKRKNKTEFLTIRVSKEEKQVIKEYCKEKKIDMSTYIYNLIAIDMSMFHMKLTE